MTFKYRILAITAICIFIGGLLTSYKSFELSQKSQQQGLEQISAEVTSWVGLAMDQKITHLESSVSYLDASTVETLKRMGARYFAYTYPVDGQWRIKSKSLGKLDRKEIVKEVNQIPLEKLSGDKRSWFHSDRGELILVSPVELSKSEQLKNGHLVFGLENDFFAFINTIDPQISLFSRKGISLVGASDKKSEAMWLRVQESSQGESVASADGSQAISNFFLKSAQAYITRSQNVERASYFTSSMFLYFIIGFFLSVGFMAILVQRFLGLDFVDESAVSAEDSVEAFRGTSTLGFDESAHMNSEATESTVEDFTGFLEDVISLEKEALEKNKIDVQVQSLEDVTVRCKPQHMTDFLQRLLNNSMKALAPEKEKRVQIQLSQSSQSYQLVYVDNRSTLLPSGEETSLFLQNESSLEFIDGIIAYGQWLFGEKMTVAKKGFCISLDLPMVHGGASVDFNDFSSLVVGEDQRIEISEEDTIENLSFEKVETGQIVETTAPEVKQEESEDFSSQSIDDIVNAFEMKDFGFNKDVTTESLEEENLDQSTDDKGLVEFNTGDFKIKIRSPKTKRDMDDHR